MVFKKIIRILKYLSFVLVIFLLLVIAAVNLPITHRFLSGEADKFLRTRNIPLKINKISLLVTGKIALNHVQLLKESGDTVLFAKSAKVSVRIFPLLFKKLVVRNVILDKTIVNISADPITAKIDLVSYFARKDPTSPTAVKVPDESGSKWDIIINSVDFRDIRFEFNNTSDGLMITQSVKRLDVKFERFSLINREISASRINIEQVRGGVIMSDSSKTEKTSGKSSSPGWKFLSGKSDIKDVQFTLHQPHDNKKYDFNLKECDFSHSIVDLSQSLISLSNLRLDEPVVKLFTSKTRSRSASGINKSSVSDFPGNLNIIAEDVILRNGFFSVSEYKNQDSGEDTSLKVESFSTEIKDFKLCSGESRFRAGNLSFGLNERFNISESDIVFSSDSTKGTILEAMLNAGSGKADLRLESTSDLTSILRSYASVPFSAEIREAEISRDELHAFLPEIFKNQSFGANKDMMFRLNCRIGGTADLLNIENLDLNMGDKLVLSASGKLGGILEPATSFCNIKFKSGMITNDFIGNVINLLGLSVKVPVIDAVVIEGVIDSSIVRPEFSISLLSNSGEMNIEGSVNIREKSYNLRTALNRINVGRLTGIDEIGKFTGHLDISGKDFVPAGMKLKTSFVVDTLGFRGYEYHSVAADLEGDNGLFKVKLISGDPSFDCDLDGSLTLNDSLTTGEVKGFFDLNAGRTHLYKNASIKSKLEAGITRSGKGLSGSLDLRNLSLQKDGRSEDLDDLYFYFQSSDRLVSGKISADFLRAEASYKGSLKDLKSDIRERIYSGGAIIDSAVGNRIPYISSIKEYQVTVDASYSPIIGLFINDTLFSYNKITINAVKDSTGMAGIDLLADKFRLSDIRVMNSSLNFKSSPEKAFMRVRTDSLRYGNIYLSGIAADINIQNDTASFRLRANDSGNRGIYDLGGLIFKESSSVRFASLQDKWLINGYSWNIPEGDFLVLEPRRKDFSANIHMDGDTSAIDISGRKSEGIKFIFKNLWLNMLLVPGMNNYGYDCNLNGKIEYSRLRELSDLGVQLKIGNLKLDQKIPGDISISGSFEADTTGNIKSDLLAEMNDTINLKVMIRSVKASDEKTINSEFIGLPLHLAGNLAKKYVTGLNGSVNGNIELRALNKKTSLNGEIKVNNITMKLIPLGARFYLPGDIIRINDNKLLFSNFTVQDSLHNMLDLNGSINISDPSNIITDLQVTSKNLQVMNTTSRDNPAFNGSVFINSDINLSGPLQKPSVKGKIVLAAGTFINFNYIDNLGVSETEKTITFARLDEENKKNAGSKPVIKSLSRSPDIEASIEIDRNTVFNFEISRGFDIGVSITGGGFLTYSLMPNKTMDLTGIYEISQGNTVLKIPGWPRKDFIITSGSLLKWNGQVDDPELNIETTSKVKGSYVNPVDNKTREVNFLVYMKLSGRLSQLQIVFDVRSEDQYITSVFNSLSADERMKQAINLLIFGSIELPNVSSSSDYVTQQINQFWESQLNRFTQSAFKNFDVSLGIDTYKSASEGGGEQTYTSLSYEVKKNMFKDRGSIIVSGRMNDNLAPGQQSNNIIENFIFEYALDTSRTKYLKVYHQQNYEDLLEGQVTKSGVGFIYRKSYDKIRDIWRKQKKRK